MKNLILSLLILSLFARLSLAAVAGTGNIEITVSKHDTLIALCDKYLERPEKWSEIARLNRLDNANRLSPGQKITIPVDMLKGFPQNGTVTFLQGNVSMRGADSSQWNSVHLRDRVEAGCSLKTGELSSAEITFEDGSQFLMRSNTVLSVKTATKGLLHLLNVLYLESGKIISRVKAATGVDSRFEIRTPSAVAVARGTEYRVAVDQLKTTRAEMLESRIDFSSKGTAVRLAQGEGSVARQNEPPSQPVKLLAPPEPVDLKQRYEEMPIRIQFSRIDRAASYRIALAKDREGKQLAEELNIRPDEDLVLQKINDGTYYLIASSIDVNGLEGSPSEPREVTAARKVIPPLPPPPHAHNFQAVATEVSDRIVSISWQPETGSTRYHIQVFDNKDSPEPVIDAKDLSGTAYTDRVPATGTYYYRIRSLPTDGAAGAWSALSEFRISPLPEPKIERVEVLKNILQTGWSSISAAVSYQVQVASDSEFNTMILDKNLQQRELSIDWLKKPGKYFLRVRGIDARQQPGEYSRTSSFEIAEPPRFPYELIGVMAVVIMLIL